MAIRIGINGFGRIGRMVFRAAMKDFTDIEVVAINDLLEPDYLAYMLKHDSVHGRFQGDVSISGDNHLVVNGKSIRLSANRHPGELKWDEVEADIVIECTGHFLTTESCHHHIEAGAKKWCNPRHPRITPRCLCMASIMKPTTARRLFPQLPVPPMHWHRWPRFCMTILVSSVD